MDPIARPPGFKSCLATLVLSNFFAPQFPHLSNEGGDDTHLIRRLPNEVSTIYVSSPFYFKKSWYSVTNTVFCYV